jgi:hypothetical protein
LCARPGSNLGEGETFILAGINFPLNDFEYTAAIMAIFGKHAQDVLK